MSVNLEALDQRLGRIEAMLSELLLASGDDGPEMPPHELAHEIRKGNRAALDAHNKRRKARFLREEKIADQHAN